MITCLVLMYLRSLYSMYVFVLIIFPCSCNAHVGCRNAVSFDDRRTKLYTYVLYLFVLCYDTDYRVQVYLSRSTVLSSSRLAGGRVLLTCSFGASEGC